MESINPLSTTKIANIKLALRKIDEALETLKDAFKIENLSENHLPESRICKEIFTKINTLP